MDRNTAIVANGRLASQFPKPLKEGDQTVFFDVFLGDNATGHLTLRVSLSISAVRQYPASNNLKFSWKDMNKPELHNVKSIVLLLVAAKNLDFHIHFAGADNEAKKPPIALAWLLQSKFWVGLALHSDEYWTKLRQY